MNKILQETMKNTIAKITIIINEFNVY